MKIIKTFLIILFILNTSVGFSQIDGEKLFKQNCAQCHKTNSGKLIGPGLKGIRERNQDEWIIKWVKNSQELIKSGDAYAVDIFKQYNNVLMPAFNLKDEEIVEIINYVDKQNSGTDKTTTTTQTASASTTTTTNTDNDGGYLNYILALFSLVLIIFIYVLNRVLKFIKIQELKNKGEKIPEEQSFFVQFTSFLNNNKRLVALVIIVFFLYLGKLGWDGMMSIGITQDYQPTQPIKFSHKIHAGDNSISCFYCHSSSQKGKAAGVPSVQLCMNCHLYISEGKTTGTVEIAKIYKALDFNPNTQVYGNNQKPIQWVRVHDLPDHVYFNHQQHVIAGKIDCEKCHGPVKTMDEISQFSPLTMKWCITCHRETDINLENGYYDKYQHTFTQKQFNDFKKGHLKVSEMGGIECGKCHY